LSLGVLIAAVVLATAPAAALARADAGKFHDEVSFSDTITNFPCPEGIPVLMTGTDIIDGHFTDAGQHLSFHGTKSTDYRVDREDGSYALGHLTDHFNFVFNVFNLNPARNVVSSAQQEQATLYAANGQVIGTITVHVTEHLTYTDLNGNHEPDPGEITVHVDQSKTTCP
jgi:hypothetical protein